ncbi:discoidin domain-containing protein, partial [bacterium]
PAIAPNTLKAVTTSSTVWNRSEAYDAAKAFDADPTTRWATPDGTKTAWLQADLLKPSMVKGIAINEAFPGRVKQFQIQYQAPGSATWETLLEGTQLGSGFKVNFRPVEARAVRLNILDAVEGPTIWEMGLDLVK